MPSQNSERVAAKTADRSPPPSLFEVGRNCSAVAHADRVAFLVNGEAYFSAFAQAALRASRSILILGWDFNSAALLRPGERPPAFAAWRRRPPGRLGDFLNWLARRRPRLRIHVLNWDYPMLFGTDRELPPIYGLGWKPHHRVHVCYDNTHPVGGSHHQKIVVIDDAMAFVGGLDLTARRWDTCEHRARHPSRVYGDTPYPPFHDLMMAVDGAAANTLAAMARERWLAATHQELFAAAGGNDPWPQALWPDLTNVDVALAQTMPESPGRPERREVQELYRDMIAAARQRIYIENQYFTSHVIGEALAARLARPDCPEIVLVTRLLSHGWLEEHTMHVLRVGLIRRLRQADRGNRFHVYYADIAGLDEGTCIDVHSKLMIVDDEVLRLGSANLSNRSMGMDSECDAIIEARGDPRIAAAIRGFRNQLLSEHLNVSAERIEKEVASQGSLSGAIESLHGGSRTLKPLEELGDWPETVVDLASLADPERPVSLDKLVKELAPRVAAERTLPAGAKLLILAMAILALAAMWRYTPLADKLGPEVVIGWAHDFAHRPWAPFVILLAYTPACIVMFPRPLITLAAVVAFGPWLGLAYSLAGILLAAFLTYVAGKIMPRGTIRNIAGTHLNAVMDVLRHRGLIAVTAVRLVPLAPFVIINLVAGAFHIKLWHFMLGTLFGMAPGAVAATIFGDQLETALVNPSDASYGLLAAMIFTLALLLLMVRSWLKKQHRKLQQNGEPGEHAS